MDNRVFTFKDEQLNAADAANGRLMILAGKEGISMLAKSADNKILALDAVESSLKGGNLAYWDEDFKDFLAAHPLMGMAFQETKIAISTPLVTLVPDRLFSPDEYQSYFKLLSAPENGRIYGHEPIEGFGCHLVWAASQGFQPLFEKSNPRHLAACLIEQYRKLADNSNYSIFINVRSQVAQVALFDQGALIFYNSFEFVKPVDLLYFTLLAFDQFKLDPQHTPLHISGCLLESSDTYKLLFKYIKDIRFLPPVSEVNLQAIEAQFPRHYWFDLLSLA
jgi:hypothetical protein